MTVTENPPTAAQQSIRTVGRQQYQSLAVMFVITIVLLGGVGSRLAYLQLMQGGRNRQLADNNQIRLIPRQPERGRILDRQGRVLAGSRLSYAVSLWPIANSERRWMPIANHLSKILKVPATDIRDRLQQAGYTSPFLVRVARGISPAQVTALAEFGSELKGVQIEAEAVRNYPYGDLAAHLLGYAAELTKTELSDHKSEGYRLGDVIGQMGVEAAFEPQLRGEWGGQQVEVDDMGRVVRVLGEKPAQPGNDVQLTIDLDIQRVAETALGNRNGSIVAIDPRNGAVLAMVSRPTFDPNLFSTQVTPAQRRQFQNQPFPFVNRALQSYAPASPFKIVTTAAAIESGRFWSEPAPTRASLPVGNIHENRQGFGSLGLTGTVAQNNETFFSQTALSLGEQPLIQWSLRFGFGQKTGIELGAEESPGLVPDADWKQRVRHEGWLPKDTVNLSIGGGDVRASPLQVAVMFAAVANAGYRVKPHLLRDNEAAQSWQESLDLKPETLQVLRSGLRQVVTDGADGLNLPGLPPIAGASGTAADLPRPNHSWFGAYAPADEAAIVVVAFGENAGKDSAALMVRQVFEAYFNGKQPDLAANPESLPAN